MTIVNCMSQIFQETNSNALGQSNTRLRVIEPA